MPSQSADEDFDPYHKWLGIPKDQRPPTHYQLLGISPNEEDEEAIEAAAERQKLFVKGFEKGPRSRTASSVLYQIEEAKVTLLNPTMRDAYDERLGIRRDYRRTYEGKSPGATDFGSGSNSVGESGGFIRDYAKFVLIFTTAFLAMAISAFYLPWEKISGNQPNVTAKPIAPQNPDLPKPVAAPEPKDEEPKPPVPPVAKADIKPQETKSESENLLVGLDIEKLTKYGRWTSEPDALNAEANPSFNSLLIPHKFPEQYTLQVDYTILAGPAVVMSIPVGRNRLRVALYADMIELSEVSNEMQRQSRHKTADYWGNAKEINFKRFSNGMGIGLSPSTRHSALIEVKKFGSDISIRIQLEGKGAIVWKGPESDLSEGTNADFWARRNDTLGSFRGLVIGTFQGSSVRLHNVKILPVSDDSRKDAPHLVRAGSIKNESSSAELPDTPHHKTALWILEQQGQFEATTLSTSGELGRTVAVFRKEQIPSQGFRITKLIFFRGPVDDSHIRKLSELSIDDVIELNLMETKVSDVGLLHVAKLKNLRSLNIAATKVDGSGFRYLTELRYLRELLCSRAPIQDSASRYLKDIPSLSTLVLSDTQVGDDGVLLISQSRSISELKINGTKVTDRGLRTLSSLKQLKKLTVSGPKITSSAVAVFRKNMPMCEVIELAGLNVVGRWKHSVNSGTEFDLTIFAEGGVNNPKGPITWDLTGNQLTMRWPSKDAPGGVWIDKCTVSPDGNTYSGKNQKGYTIRGTRIR